MIGLRWEKRLALTAIRPTDALRIRNPAAAVRFSRR